MESLVPPGPQPSAGSGRERRRSTRQARAKDKPTYVEQAGEFEEVEGGGLELCLVVQRESGNSPEQSAKSPRRRKKRPPKDEGTRRADHGHGDESSSLNGGGRVRVEPHSALWKFGRSAYTVPTNPAPPPPPAPSLKPALKKARRRARTKKTDAAKGPGEFAEGRGEQSSVVVPR